MAKINRIKRRAAGFVLVHLFSNLTQVCWALTRITSTGMHEDQLGRGLTPKEIELIKRMRDDISERADILRIVGWRLLGYERHHLARRARKR